MKAPRDQRTADAAHSFSKSEKDSGFLEFDSIGLVFNETVKNTSSLNIP